MKKEKFPIVFNVLLAFFITLVVTLFVKAGSGQLTAEAILVSMVIGFSINFSLETLIDLPGMGNAVCNKLGIKNPMSPLAYFVRIFVIVFVMALIMSLLVMFTEIGFAMGLGFFAFWITKFPVIFLVAYITALITVGPSMAVTGKICCK